MMIRTIEEISRQKSEGKKKWGKELLEFINPFVEAELTYEEIANILSEKHNIEIKATALRNLKSKHKHKFKKENLSATPNIDSFENKELKDSNKIVQNKELIDVQAAYDSIYPQTKKNEFDLGNL